MIQGIAKKIKYGDTIDLPDEVAIDLMKRNTDFQEVIEIRPKKIKTIKMEDLNGK